MSSFEWMEMQTLATEIAAARARLSAARRSNNRDLVRTLEEEIAAAEARRIGLRASITTDVVGAAEPAARPEAPEVTENPAAAAVEEPQQSPVDESEPPIMSEGVVVMSDQLVAIDAIEGASRQLGARRAEMLARHAEELRALDADQNEIDAMAQAMNAFLRKYNLAPAERAVVQFDEERDLRLQVHG